MISNVNSYGIMNEKNDDNEKVTHLSYRFNRICAIFLENETKILEVINFLV